jgi:phosphatidate cytidylyltransferase
MLKLRVITSLIALVVVGVVLFVVPAKYVELIIGLLLVAGAWEWSGFLDTSGNVLRVVYTALVAACFATVYFVVPEMTGTILVAAFAWWFVAFLWTLFYPTKIPLPLRWICGLLVLVPLFVALVQLFRAGLDYLLFTLMIVWAADAGAYFAGKAFGRVKLAPAISPGKTWEGVIGGLVLVAALAIGVGIWRDLSIEVFLPFVLAVAALSVVGDLTVSMFKRTVGLKDSGSLFPGHGGVLDRIDSVAAAAPLFALGLGWLGLV